MIKVTYDAGDGRRTLLLGLSDENIRRLRNDQLIFFLGEQVGLAGWNVAIVTGPTEQEIVDRLAVLGISVEAHE